MMKPYDMFPLRGGKTLGCRLPVIVILLIYYKYSASGHTFIFLLVCES